MPNTEFVTRTPERMEFLKDIVICFVEDYGTNPWRRIAAYSPSEGTATFIDVEEDDKSYDITIATVATGLGKIKSGAVDINSTMKTNIVRADRENEAGDIDAYDADAIVQAAVFGELIYG